MQTSYVHTFGTSCSESFQEYSFITLQTLFPCNIAKFLVTYTCEIGFHDVINRTVPMECDKRFVNVSIC